MRLHPLYSFERVTQALLAMLVTFRKSGSTFREDLRTGRSKHCTVVSIARWRLKAAGAEQELFGKKVGIGS